MSKKTFLTFVLIICTLICSAQIKRDYLGFTLGTTTKATVCKYLKDNHITYTENEQDEYMAQNIRFGGHVWDYVWFSFHDGKLYNIDFSISDDTTPIETLDLKYQGLCNSMYKKYANYYDNASSNEKKEYNDGVVSITIRCYYFEGSKTLALMYTYLPLLFEKISSEEDEL